MSRTALDTAFNAWGFLNIAAMLFLIFSGHEPRWALILWIASIGSWMAVERIYYQGHR